eukprot:TRINITY_DN3648_c0_g3_i2.p1 TRINITY_DN3648_c0_g3~~TRINITY_DN3648_c0_g3_i2.p1  ORF type:complete len:1023 (+),score=197.58 TRINITY_DN3648_c0_g3_i2:481-3549(+)
MSKDLDALLESALDDFVKQEKDIASLSSTSSLPPLRPSPPASSSLSPSSLSASSPSSSSVASSLNNNNKSDDVDSADSLKDRGNVFYKNGALEDALSLYLQALSLRPQDPVFASNASAVLYELGRYRECIEKVDMAINNIANSNNNPSLLHAKVLARKVKCLSLLKRYNEAKDSLATLISIPDHKTVIIQNEIQLLQEALSYERETSSSSSSSSLFQTLPRYRPASASSCFEYYVVGHDKASSALSGLIEVTEEQEDVEAKDYDEVAPPQNLGHHDSLEKDSPLRLHISRNDDISLLFAGIGDARHLFATIIDLAQQMKQTPSPSSSSWKVHCTMIDLVPAIFARDLLLFHIIDKLGVALDHHAQGSLEVVMIVSVLLYLYLGELIPCYIYDRLLVYIAELEECLRLGGAGSLPPHMSMRESDLPAILDVLAYWKVAKYSKKSLFKAIKQGELHSEQMRKSTGIRDMMDNRRAEMIATINSLTDEEILDMNKKTGGRNITAAEHRADLIAMMYDDDAVHNILRSNSAGDATIIEKEIFKQTHAITPPLLLRKEYGDDDFTLLIDMINERRETDPTVAQRLKKTIRQSERWLVNPTFHDKAWTQKNGLRALFHDPYNLCADLYGILLPFPRKENSLYKQLDILFITLAESYKSVKAHIHLEWAVAELTQFCLLQLQHNDSEVGEKKHFDRVYLSNIPDYTGGALCVFLYVTPLLKSLPSSFTSFNVLLNTTKWSDYTSHIYEYTLLPTLDLSRRIFGARYICGHLMTDEPRWGLAPTLPIPRHDLFSVDALTSYLMRLFLFLTLPVDQVPNQHSRINYPLNMLSFVATLHRLVAVGYPPHWISSVLAQLLSGSISTRARPPMLDNKNLDLAPTPTAICTLPFLPDLELALSVYKPILSFGLPFPILPISSYTKYSITIPGYFSLPFFITQIPVMALYFMHPDEDPRHLSKLRYRIQTARLRVYLTSIIEWDEPSQTACFWMTKKRHASMLAERWSVVVVRLDLYAPVSMETTLVAKARIVKLL